MTEGDGSSIPLLTLTRLWLFSRHLYGLNGRALWVPVSHRAVGYSLAVFAPLWLVLEWLGVPFHGFGWTVHAVLPGLLVWWALRTVGDGARPEELVWSWVRLVWHVARRRAGVRPARVRSVARCPVGGVPVRVRER